MNTIHLAAGCPCLLNSDGGLLVPCTAHTLREHARHGHYWDAPCAICDTAADPHQSRHDAFAVWFCDDSDEPIRCSDCGATSHLTGSPAADREHRRARGDDS